MSRINEASGLLKQHKGKAMLIDPDSFLENKSRGILVPHALVKQYKLVNGVKVSGPVKKGNKGLILEKIESICDLEPELFKNRKDYTKLTALTPEERFNLSITNDPSMRIVDLIAPIAKGTRGLIVSPPKAGKTILLEQIANSIHAFDPKTRIIALLVDERPEEVTHFRRQVNAEVLASSNDQDVKRHIELTELVMAHVKAELECGKDVVVLVDSLTRMARAFNLGSPSKQGKGRIMSGGLQAGALEIPRRFFGMARNIENGGSVTIIASVLVDTGSRMDQLIFEEFKGTGNSEIILDRKIAEARIFPAINLQASGTRREELLFPAKHYKQVTRLRRAVSKLNNPQKAVEQVLKFLSKYPTNEDFLNESVAS